MTELRNKHYPRDLNHLDAHVALFRALPGSQLGTIHRDIERVVQETAPFAIRTTLACAQRHGVIIGVRGRRASIIYEQLKLRWMRFLSPQDRRGFSAHYTIQNKVDPNRAERTAMEIRETFKGSQGIVMGLVLYRFENGPWRDGRTFLFGAEEVAKRDRECGKKTNKIERWEFEI